MAPVPLRRGRSTARSVVPGGLLLLGALHAGAAAASSQAASPDTVAQGGTARADVDGLASIVVAPALLPLVPRYQLQGGVLFGPDKRIGVRAYAVDSNTGPVTLGLAYHYDHSVPQSSDEELPGWVLPDEDLSNEKASTRLAGTIGTSFVDRRIGVALGVSWLQSESRFADKRSWLNGSFSVAGAAGVERQLVGSVTADNLLTPGSDDDPLTFGIGAGYRPVPVFGLFGQLDLVTGAFDGPVDIGFGAGAEGVLADVVSLRGGFRRDAERASDLATAGLGVHSENVALDYAAEFVVGHADAPPAGWEDDKLRHYHHVALKLSF